MLAGMEMLKTFLESQPLVALFLVIASGYALGAVPIRGLSFGAGAVLFSGLLVGAIAPRATPPGMVGTLGLLMFLYGVGIQYGKQFFAGLAGPGLVWNGLSLVAVGLSLLVALQLGAWLGLPVGTAVGLFAGSGTSTAALQAALAAAGTQDPAVGYSVSYPFGVVGPILAIHFWTALFRPALARPPPALRYAEVTVDRPEVTGQTIGALAARLPEGVAITGLRRDHTNLLPDAATVIEADDALLLVGQPAAVEAAIAMLGRADPQRLAKDRRDLDMVRVFVSKPAMLGRPLAELPRPAFPIRVSHVRRGDLDLMAEPDLVIEAGDRLIVLAPADRLAEVRAHYGDSIRATADFSFISVGLGMTLGLLLGLVRIPAPGIGSFSLGVAGGPLVMALVLGRLGRTGPIGWRMPAPANLVLRNLGLTLFLAAVAMGAGKPFVDTVASTGPAILVAGAIVLLTNVLVVLSIGQFVLRVPYDSLVGVMAGATGNPAIPAFGARLLGSDRVDVGYATIFPSMTIAKVIMAQVAVAVLGATQGA
jgi:putative transport protein